MQQPMSVIFINNSARKRQIKSSCNYKYALYVFYACRFGEFDKVEFDEICFDPHLRIIIDVYKDIYEHNLAKYGKPDI